MGWCVPSLLWAFKGNGTRSTAGQVRCHGAVLSMSLFQPPPLGAGREQLRLSARGEGALRGASSAVLVPLQLRHGQMSEVSPALSRLRTASER